MRRLDPDIEIKFVDRHRQHGPSFRSGAASYSGSPCDTLVASLLPTAHIASMPDIRHARKPDATSRCCASATRRRNTCAAYSASASWRAPARPGGSDGGECCRAVRGVLDLGSGSGVDSLLAANRTGPAGEVIGVDYAATTSTASCPTARSTPPGSGASRASLCWPTDPDRRGRWAGGYVADGAAAATAARAVDLPVRETECCSCFTTRLCDGT